MFGLLDRDMKHIKDVLLTFKEIETAILFGSRVMGNYKKGSDVDIAIVGKNVTRQTILKLDEYLNEMYPLPYFFDIVHYNECSNEKLIKHIDELGIEIYVKSASK
jgi:predicted nucleotidyltransferase